jgi:hypothetical protein
MPRRIVATNSGAVWEIGAVAPMGSVAPFAASPCQIAEAFSAVGSTVDGRIAGNGAYTCRILVGRTRVKVINRRQSGTIGAVSPQPRPGSPSPMPSIFAPVPVECPDTRAGRRGARCDYAPTAPAG